MTPQQIESEMRRLIKDRCGYTEAYTLSHHTRRNIPMPRKPAETVIFELNVLRIKPMNPAAVGILRAFASLNQAELEYRHSYVPRGA